MLRQHQCRYEDRVCAFSSSARRQCLVSESHEHAGGARMAAEFKLRLLGELPLDIHIREEADGGRPSVVAAPGTPRAVAYANMARNVAGQLAVQGKDRSSLFPKIVVEET